MRMATGTAHGDLLALSLPLCLPRLVPRHPRRPAFTALAYCPLIAPSLAPLLASTPLNLPP